MLNYMNIMSMNNVSSPIEGINSISERLSEDVDALVESIHGKYFSTFLIPVRLNA